MGARRQAGVPVTRSLHRRRGGRQRRLGAAAAGGGDGGGEAASLTRVAGLTGSDVACAKRWGRRWALAAPEDQGLRALGTLRRRLCEPRNRDSRQRVCAQQSLAGATTQAGLAWLAPPPANAAAHVLSARCRSCCRLYRCCEALFHSLLAENAPRRQPERLLAAGAQHRRHRCTPPRALPTACGWHPSSARLLLRRPPLPRSLPFSSQQLANAFVPVRAPPVSVLARLAAIPATWWDPASSE